MSGEAYELRKNASETSRIHLCIYLYPVVFHYGIQSGGPTRGVGSQYKVLGSRGLEKARQAAESDLWQVSILPFLLPLGKRLSTVGAADTHLPSQPEREAAQGRRGGREWVGMQLGWLCAHSLTYPSSLSSPV